MAEVKSEAAIALVNTRFEVDKKDPCKTIYVFQTCNHAGDRIKRKNIDFDNFDNQLNSYRLAHRIRNE